MTDTIELFTQAAQILAVSPNEAARLSGWTCTAKAMLWLYAKSCLTLIRLLW